MRGIVFVGLCVRVAITRDAYTNKALTVWVVGLLFFAIYTVYLLRATAFGGYLMSQKLALRVVVADTLFFALFYAHAGRPHSDLYLFFFLPLLIAAERFAIYQVLRSFAMISMAFFASFIWLSLRAVDSSDLPIWRMFVQNALPRWTFFFFVLFLAFMRVRLLTEGEQLLIRKRGELNLIRTIALSIGTGEAMRPRLQEALAGARDLLHCSGAVIYLARAHTLEVVAQVGLPGGDKQLEVLQRDEGLAGETLRTRVTMIVNDYQAWPQRVERLDSVTAVLAVPLVAGKDPSALGVLSVFDTTGQRQFEPDDATLLENLAQHAALAVRDQLQLDDARKRAKALEVIFDCSQELIKAQMNLDLVLECVAHHASELTRVFHHDRPTHAYVAIADERSEHLSFEAGYPAATLQLLNDKLSGVHLTGKRIGIIGRAFRNETVEISGDVQTDPDYISIDDSIRSQIALPLRTRNRMIGVVAIESSTPNAFATDSAFYLELLANASAAAIENVRLIKAIADQQRRGEELLRSYGPIVAAREVSALGEAVLQSLATLLPYDEATLFLTSTEPTRAVECRPLLLNVRMSVNSNDTARASLPLMYGDVVLGHIEVGPAEAAAGADSDPVIAAFLQTAASVLQVALLHEDRISQLRELEATKDHLETLLENLNEYNNLALIGIVYGEDFHIANDRLGAARVVLSKLARETHDAYVRLKIDEVQAYLRSYLEVLEKTRDTAVTKPEIEGVNVHQLLDAVLASKTRSNIEIRRAYEVPSGMDVIKAPTSQLRQVFLVIIQNAIDAIGNIKGILKVVTRPAGTSALFIEISNTGAAIPPERLERIFEGLRRRLDAEPARKRGTGMGLFWARNFLRIFGGNIRIDSTDRLTKVVLQVPTDFTIRMPFLRKGDRLDGSDTRSDAGT